jgi:hypothetical protein
MWGTQAEINDCHSERKRGTLGFSLSRESGRGKLSAQNT